MGTLASFELPLKGMPCGTRDYEFHLGEDFFREFDCADVLSSDVKVTLSVERVGDDYDLRFHCVGTIGIPCDRCLDEMKHDVDAQYKIVVKYGEEYNDESDVVLIIPESDNQFNVASLIFDTVMLTIPIKHTHAPGECNSEMAEQLKMHAAISINEDDEAYDDFSDDLPTSDDIDCEPTSDDAPCDPRWEALRKLKDKN